MQRPFATHGYGLSAYAISHINKQLRRCSLSTLPLPLPLPLSLSLSITPAAACFVALDMYVCITDKYHWRVTGKYLLTMTYIHVLLYRSRVVCRRCRRCLFAVATHHHRDHSFFFSLFHFCLIVSHLGQKDTTQYFDITEWWERWASHLYNAQAHTVP